MFLSFNQLCDKYNFDLPPLLSDTDKYSVCVALIDEAIQIDELRACFESIQAIAKFAIETFPAGQYHHRLQLISLFPNEFLSERLGSLDDVCKLFNGLHGLHESSGRMLYLDLFGQIIAEKITTIQELARFCAQLNCVSNEIPGFLSQYPILRELLVSSRRSLYDCEPDENFRHSNSKYVNYALLEFAQGNQWDNCWTEKWSLDYSCQSSFVTAFNREATASQKAILFINAAQYKEKTFINTLSPSAIDDLLGEMARVFCEGKELAPDLTTRLQFMLREMGYGHENPEAMKNFIAKLPEHLAFRLCLYADCLQFASPASCFSFFSKLCLGEREVSASEFDIFLRVLLQIPSESLIELKWNPLVPAFVVGLDLSAREQFALQLLVHNNDNYSGWALIYKDSFVSTAGYFDLKQLSKLPEDLRVCAMLRAPVDPAKENSLDEREVEEFVDALSEERRASAVVMLKLDFKDKYLKLLVEFVSKILPFLSEDDRSSLDKYLEQHNFPQCIAIESYFLVTAPEHWPPLIFNPFLEDVLHGRSKVGASVYCCSPEKLRQLRWSIRRHGLDGAFSSNSKSDALYQRYFSAIYAQSRLPNNVRIRQLMVLFGTNKAVLEVNKSEALADLIVNIKRNLSKDSKEKLSLELDEMTNDDRDLLPSYLDYQILCILLGDVTVSPCGKTMVVLICARNWFRSQALRLPMRCEKVSAVADYGNVPGLSATTELPATPDRRPVKAQATAVVNENDTAVYASAHLVTPTRTADDFSENHVTTQAAASSSCWERSPSKQAVVAESVVESSSSSSSSSSGVQRNLEASFALQSDIPSNESLDEGAESQQLVSAASQMDNSEYIPLRCLQERVARDPLARQAYTYVKALAFFAPVHAEDEIYESAREVLGWQANL
jgi:hypothetical protein